MKEPKPLYWELVMSVAFDDGSIHIESYSYPTWDDLQREMRSADKWKRFCSVMIRPHFADALIPPMTAEALAKMFASDT